MEELPDGRIVILLADEVESDNHVSMVLGREHFVDEQFELILAHRRRYNLQSANDDSNFEKWAAHLD